MEFKFLDRIMVKSKLRRTETFVRGANNKKQWDIDRFKHPKLGVVIGYRLLSNGESEYQCNDEPIIYHPKDYFKAFLVVIDEKHNPIYVLPEEAFTAEQPKENMFSQSEITKTCA